MLLVFIDETGDSKYKEYLGFSIATIDSFFYPLLKIEAQKILLKMGWDPSIEFKGSYLFSATKGCTSVTVENRVEAANKLLDLNIASSNSRMKFHYGHLKSTDHRADYLAYLPPLLTKSLPLAKKGAGKKLIVISCDERSDISPDELHSALSPASNSRGYVLLERVMSTKSTFDTVGIMFADLVGYLAARIDTISNDSDLFDGITPEQYASNGKLRKLRSSSELIAKIKELQLYTYNDPPKGR